MNQYRKICPKCKKEYELNCEIGPCPECGSDLVIEEIEKPDIKVVKSKKKPVFG